MSQTVLSDVRDGIAIMTLNRPEKLNAWDTPMRMDIAAKLKEWNSNETVRAIIVTGAGERAFSAGQDLDETEKFQSGSDVALEVLWIFPTDCWEEIEYIRE